jgi:predicted nucleotidyltransferase component of viral defense system
MTNEIKELLEKIKDNNLFDGDDFYFVGGTALSYYLNHRVSYVIDIAAIDKLPISKINAFAFSLGAKAIPDVNASSFRINTGEDIKNYYMKFMINGIKLEFSYFRSEIQKEIFKSAGSQPYSKNSKLKILDLNDIVKLKIFALFNRQKTRDLFDTAIILEKNLQTLEEIERVYSFTQNGSLSIREYIDKFNSLDDDGDNSLDFLPQHPHYKTFGKKNQVKRFQLAKEMFLKEYEIKQKESLKLIQRSVKKDKKS